MNKISTLLLSLASTAMILSSCDEVKENDRYIEMPMVEAQRTVLIEDFTGQSCKNCPNAHDVIHDLYTQYGEDAIAAVALHPAGNGLVITHTEQLGNNGLGNEDAAKIASVSGMVNNASLPKGNINRSSGIVDYQAWAALVRSALEESSPLLVEGSVSGNIDDNTKRTVDLQVTATENFSGKINVWIVEDGITGLQTMPDGNIDWNYVHNHVLRKSVTAFEGETVSIQKAIIFEKSYNLEFENLWVPDNCKAVVFFTGSDGKVVQAHSIPLLLISEEDSQE